MICTRFNAFGLSAVLASLSVLVNAQGTQPAGTPANTRQPAVAQGYTQQPATGQTPNQKPDERAGRRAVPSQTPGLQVNELPNLALQPIVPSQPRRMLNVATPFEAGKPNANTYAPNGYGQTANGYAPVPNGYGQAAPGARAGSPFAPAIPGADQGAQNPNGPGAYRPNINPVQQPNMPNGAGGYLGAEVGGLAQAPGQNGYAGQNGPAGELPRGVGRTYAAALVRARSPILVSMPFLVGQPLEPTYLLAPREVAAPLEPMAILGFDPRAILAPLYRNPFWEPIDLDMPTGLTDNALTVNELANLAPVEVALGTPASPLADLSPVVLDYGPTDPLVFNRGFLPYRILPWQVMQTGPRVGVPPVQAPLLPNVGLLFGSGFGAASYGENLAASVVNQIRSSAVR